MENIWQGLKLKGNTGQRGCLCFAYTVERLATRQGGWDQILFEDIVPVNLRTNGAWADQSKDKQTPYSVNGVQPLRRSICLTVIAYALTMRSELLCHFPVSTSCHLELVSACRHWSMSAFRFCPKCWSVWTDVILGGLPRPFSAVWR